MRAHGRQELVRSKRQYDKRGYWDLHSYIACYGALFDCHRTVLLDVGRDIAHRLCFFNSGVPLGGSRDGLSRYQNATAALR